MSMCGCKWMAMLVWVRVRRYVHERMNTTDQTKEDRWGRSVQTTPLVLIIHSCSRKASLKCTTDPYKYWNWEFAPSAWIRASDCMWNWMRMRVWTQMSENVWEYKRMCVCLCVCVSEWAFQEEWREQMNGHVGMSECEWAREYEQTRVYECAGERERECDRSIDNIYVCRAGTSEWVQVNERMSTSESGCMGVFVCTMNEHASMSDWCEWVCRFKRQASMHASLSEWSVWV